MRALQAVIYDMDGVIIDSEPFWQEAEIAVFAEVGIALTREQCLETTGLRIDEVVALRHQQQPWADRSLDSVADAIVDGVIERVKSRGTPLDGVTESIAFFQSLGVPLALASSSPTRLIDGILDGLALRDAFPIVHSAEHESFGKPHPAVYESTLRSLGVGASGAIAIEDSKNGVTSAKSAGMACIAIPDRTLDSDEHVAHADVVLRSLRNIDHDTLSALGFVAHS